jgi:hypothetical protein
MHNMTVDYGLLTGSPARRTLVLESGVCSILVRVVC